MFRLVFIYAFLHVDQVISFSLTCRPPYNCEGCSSPYLCDRCPKGTFKTRDPNHLGCVPCSKVCASCDYADHCQECVKGRFGGRCHIQCSTGCFNRLCEKRTGKCTCMENFTGSTCDTCTHGRYGTNCHLICSDGCLDGTCDKITGECVCKPGYTGLNCSECIHGRYGHICQSMCGIGCTNGTCDQQTGHCKCKDNFTREKCDRCVDGNYDMYSNCTLTCPTTCFACQSEAFCTICKAGLIGNTCNMLQGNCSEGNGPCPPANNLCKTSGKLADNCTVSCIKHCTLCSSSELCPQCESGYWASNCLQTCPDNCLNGVCNIDNGTCTYGCKPGYHGRHCACNKDNICIKFGDSHEYNRGVIFAFAWFRAVVVIIMMLIFK